MKRIFADYAYGDGPRTGCWWDETCPIPDRPALVGRKRCDVAIIGAGFTGLSAALHLAQAGVAVTVLDARHVGWGASGRNGGFCCLGGSKADDATLESRFGRDGRLEYRATEKNAVALVETLISRLGLEVDRHSHGETELAHRPKDMAMLEIRAKAVQENYGVIPRLHAADTLVAEGLAGPFHGGLTIPVGFGLNPRKYVAGLALAAEASGAEIFHGSPVDALDGSAGRFQLRSGSATLEAQQVIVATNGYSSDDIPDWLNDRYMPAQSTVLVTRPLTVAELDAAGWTSDQMAYDTRNLLHYFRLMPDRRFLFGMRGGLMTGPRAEGRAREATRRDFEKMFPAWAHVEAPWSWSGMVCLARDMLPFVGPVPGRDGLWAGLCYHGNGVAMGTFSGQMLAGLIQGGDRSAFPKALSAPLSRFPLGNARRLLMPAVYAGLMAADW